MQWLLWVRCLCQFAASSEGTGTSSSKFQTHVPRCFLFLLATCCTWKNNCIISLCLYVCCSQSVNTVAQIKVRNCVWCYMTCYFHSFRQISLLTNVARWACWYVMMKAKGVVHQKRDTRRRRTQKKQVWRQMCVLSVFFLCGSDALRLLPSVLSLELLKWIAKTFLKMSK